MGAAERVRASGFQRALDAGRGADETRLTTRLSSLNPSLRQDLARFEQKGRQSELLEVVAGAVRHATAVTVHLQLQAHVLALTVYPMARLVHSALPMDQFLALQLTDLEVLRVEGALLQPPDLLALSQLALLQDHYAPLGMVMWELALRGARDELLPEIAGQAAYRITPTLDLRTLALTGTLALACKRLQRHTSSLRDIAEWPGFDRARAMRLLNALYLQPGLMVSRTHPAATNDGWFSSTR